MRGRPFLYLTDEDRKKAIHNNQLKAYLKRNGKTIDEYNQWKDELNKKKELRRIKKQLREALNTDNLEKLLIIKNILVN